MSAHASGASVRGWVGGYHIRAALLLYLYMVGGCLLVGGWHCCCTAVLLLYCSAGVVLLLLDGLVGGVYAPCQGGGSVGYGWACVGIIPAPLAYQPVNWCCKRTTSTW